MGRIDKIPRGSFMAGPVLNKNLGTFDKRRANLSGAPVAWGEDINYIEACDDFNQKALDTTNRWSVLTDASGTAFAISANAENGQIVGSSAPTTDDNGTLIQESSNKVFLLKSGLGLWFFSRVKVSTAAACQMFVGLADTVATNVVNAVGSTQKRVGFQISKGSAVIKMSVNDGTTDTLTSTKYSAADATFVELALRVEGGSVIYYVNRQKAGVISIPAALAAIPLGMCFMGMSGNASGTHTRHADYLVAIKSRQARSAAFDN
jgi:hypothetical protein